MALGARVGRKRVGSASGRFDPALPGKAGDAGRVPAAEPPSWVSEWLAKRSETAEKKKQKAEKPAAAPDPVLAAKRAEKRADRVRDGIEALELWMGDLVRTGLAVAR